MQPYFFPYFSYFQLIDCVDKFVFFDDVNYIVRGWVNRNRILINGSDGYLTLPLNKASQNKKINEINIIDEKIKTHCLFLAQNDNYMLVNDKFTYDMVRQNFKGKTLEDGVILYSMVQLSRRYDNKTYKLTKHVLTMTEATKKKEPKKKQPKKKAEIKIEVKKIVKLKKKKKVNKEAVEVDKDKLHQHHIIKLKI